MRGHGCIFDHRPGFWQFGRFGPNDSGRHGHQHHHGKIFGPHYGPHHGPHHHGLRFAHHHGPRHGPQHHHGLRFAHQHGPSHGPHYGTPHHHEINHWIHLKLSHGHQKPNHGHHKHHGLEVQNTSCCRGPHKRGKLVRHHKSGAETSNDEDNVSKPEEVQGSCDETCRKRKKGYAKPWRRGPYIRPCCNKDSGTSDDEERCCKRFRKGPKRPCCEKHCSGTSDAENCPRSKCGKSRLSRFEKRKCTKDMCCDKDEEEGLIIQGIVLEKVPRSYSV